MYHLCIPFSLLSNIPSCKYTKFVYHLSFVGHLDCFHFGGSSEQFIYEHSYRSIHCSVEWNSWSYGKYMFGFLRTAKLFPKVAKSFNISTSMCEVPLSSEPPKCFQAIGTGLISNDSSSFSATHVPIPSHPGHTRHWV
jgi:hypothetical protein